MKQQMKQQIKQSHGITVITLAIMIIVLLIIIGVVFFFLTNNENDNNNVVTNQTVENEVINDVEEEVSTEEETVTLPSDTGTTPYLPSKDFKQLTETDLSTGLVIEDNLGNQYVWIEVPRTEKIYTTSGTEITEGSDGKYTDAEYESIEKDLQTYSANYRGDTNYTDTWNSTEQTGLTSDEYTELKQTMLKSVYQNGGFWIGRYETGIENSYRNFSNGYDSTVYNEEHPITETPVIKANAYPYNWVQCSQAQELASKMNSGDYTSSLIFGLQWDLVLKYLEIKGLTESEINQNSTTWGNYFDNPDNTITSNFAKYSLDSGINWSNATYNEKSAGGMLTTGASNTFCKQNIYDIAGNVYEWTLEYCSTSSANCVFRGGYYEYSGEVVPASQRDIGNSTYSTPVVGFRVTLY